MFLTFFYLFVYIGPFGPLPNFFGRSNHTNLTRRIDPRHPEPPNSPISPKRAFSFFRFLGLGESGPFSGLQGRGGAQSGEGTGRVWGNAPGHRPLLAL